MPWTAATSEGVVTPSDNNKKFDGDNDLLTCPHCNGPMRYVSPAINDDGTLKARSHFRHTNSNNDETEGPGGCIEGGESPEHEEMKRQAIEELQKEHPSISTVTVEEDIGEKTADVTGKFDTPHPEYGSGICVEVQFKNKEKDFIATTEEYVSEGYSVYWVFLTVTKEDWEPVIGSRHALSAVFDDYFYAPTVSEIGESPDFGKGSPITPKSPTREHIDINSMDPVQYALGWREYVLHEEHRAGDRPAPPRDLVQVIQKGIETTFDFSYDEYLPPKDGVLQIARRYIALSLIDLFISHSKSQKPRATQNILDIWKDIRSSLYEESLTLRELHAEYTQSVRSSIETTFSEQSYTVVEDVSLPIECEGELPRGDMKVQLDLPDDQVKNGVVIDIVPSTQNHPGISKSGVLELYTNDYCYTVLRPEYPLQSPVRITETQLRDGILATSKTILFKNKLIGHIAGDENGSEYPILRSTTYDADTYITQGLIETGETQSQVPATLPSAWIEDAIQGIWESQDWDRITWGRTSQQLPMDSFKEYPWEYYLSEAVIQAERDQRNLKQSLLSHTLESNHYPHERYINEALTSLPKEQGSETEVPATIHVAQWLQSDKRVYSLTNREPLPVPAVSVPEEMILVPASLKTDVINLALYNQRLTQIDQPNWTYPYEKEAIEVAISTGSPHPIVPATFHLETWLLQSGGVYNIDDGSVTTRIKKFGDDILIPQRFSEDILSKITPATMKDLPPIDQPDMSYDIIQCRWCEEYWELNQTYKNCPACGANVDFQWNLDTDRLSQIEWDWYKNTL